MYQGNISNLLILVKVVDFIEKHLNYLRICALTKQSTVYTSKCWIDFCYVDYLSMTILILFLYKNSRLLCINNKKNFKAK